MPVTHSGSHNSPSISPTARLYLLLHACISLLACIDTAITAILDASVPPAAFISTRLGLIAIVNTSELLPNQWVTLQGKSDINLQTQIHNYAFILLCVTKWATRYMSFVFILDMVSTRLFFPHSRSSHEVRLRSRLYPAVSSSPCYVSVVTRQMCPFSVHSRLPFPEHHFGQIQLQPYIHNCMVTIREGRRQHHFMVFFKRHCRLLENRCLKTMVQGDVTTIQGDIIIMRMGSKASYVNLRTGDAKRTDWLVRQLCRSPLFSRTRLPSRINYRKS